jgi:hypothetical protein
MESCPSIGRNDQNTRPDASTSLTSTITCTNSIFSEYLKTVPDLLETLMSEKRLLQGSILLVRSLKIINNPDMHEIGAVADLRSYLETQETVRSFRYSVSPF